MKQVVVIHGGQVFESHQEYLSYLRAYKIESLENLERKDWKSSLGKELGDEYQVIPPKMPLKENAKYSEWKILFEKIVPFLQDGVILIGHSLGGKFLAKYLSEETFPKKIRATILVAAPFGHGTKKGTGGFALPASLTLFERQGGAISLYHSKDDPIVRISGLEKYRVALPGARVRVFEDRQHFNQESFPELLADIKEA